jgi:hypothetical protein
MSCCGQNRQAWREWKPAALPAAAPSPPVLQNPVALRHLGTSSLVIKGAITEHTYLFAGQDTTLDVDERDVSALLATGRFVRASLQI